MLVVGKASVHPENVSMKTRRNLNPFYRWHVGEIYLPVLCGKMPMNLVDGKGEGGR